MTTTLNFKAYKPIFKPVNENRHDEAAWATSYEIAATFEPANTIPHQYAVHCVYEMLNRPWLSDPVNLRAVTNWLEELRHTKVML